MNKARREGLILLAIAAAMLVPPFAYLYGVDYNGSPYPAWAHALVVAFCSMAFGVGLIGLAQFTSGKPWDGLGLSGESPLKLRPKRDR